MANVVFGSGRPGEGLVERRRRDDGPCWPVEPGGFRPRAEQREECLDEGDEEAQEQRGFLRASRVMGLAHECLPQ